jgi:cysteine desulfurase / selenocysteine lyase
MGRSISAFHREFPQLRGKVYFNHGAASIPPASVLKASIEGVKLAADFSLNPATQATWNRVRDETRAMAAELIGASPRNVAFVANTSTALSLISLAIPWKRGDNVVTGSVENPATVVPWQNLRHLGVSVRYLPADKDDLFDLSSLARYVDARTRLVALSLVEYSTGQRLDLRRVARFCRHRGIFVSADAVQAVGAIPVDVKALGVNFLAAGAQKWLMGPRGIAFLYADDDALGRIRSPIVTEDNVPSIQAEEELPTSGHPQLKVHEGALKLEAVPYSNFPGVCGLHQALTNLRSVGEAVVHERLHEITSELADGLGMLDGRVVSPRGENEWSGIVSFAPAGAPAKEIVARLRRHGVFIAMRKGRLRICPHFYNTSAEVREFLSMLKETMRSLGKTK